MKRKIITIDHTKCNGCGACIPNCPEGALQIIDGKAHLVSDLFCDGLGACIGSCPEGAVTIEEREAEPYNEAKVMQNVVVGGTNVIKAHVDHLRDHGQEDYYKEALLFLRRHEIPLPASTNDPPKAPNSGCPGMQTVYRTPDPAGTAPAVSDAAGAEERPSALRQWPVQLHLINPAAPWFANADLVIAADCVAFTMNGFHERFLAGRRLIIFCPKLDNAHDIYTEKLAEIFRRNTIQSITTVRMEVPCCAATRAIVDAAVCTARKQIRQTEAIIALDGTLLSEKENKHDS